MTSLIPDLTNSSLRLPEMHKTYHRYRCKTIIYETFQENSVYTIISKGSEEPEHPCIIPEPSLLAHTK